MSGWSAVVVVLLLGVGLAAVVLAACRKYAGAAPWWRLLPSLTPITLVAGAVLVLASGGS